MKVVYRMRDDLALGTINKARRADSMCQRGYGSRSYDGRSCQRRRY